MQRRRYSAAPRRYPAKRSVDKVVRVLALTTTANVFEETLVQDPLTYPATATGWRWEFTVFNGTTDVAQFTWVLARVQDGDTSGSINPTGNPLYQPEQEMIAFGNGLLNGTTTANGTNLMKFQGDTKSSRKLKVGDTFVFKIIANNVLSVSGAVQHFNKI